MIYFHTAMYHEAAAVIERYRMKKKSEIREFQVFEDRDRSTMLIVGGTGPVNGSVSSAYLLSKFPPEEHDVFVNLGVCGSLSEKFAPGDIVLCNKIIDGVTRRSLYPEMIYRHPFSEGCLYSSGHIITAQCDQDSTECRNPCQLPIGTELIDMEGAFAFQAAAKFLPLDRIFIVKIVSDYLDLGTHGRAGGSAADQPRDVTGEKIRGLFAGRNICTIEEWLKDIDRYDNRVRIQFSGKDTALLDKLKITMRLTASMRAKLEKYCRHAVLTGRRITDILDKYVGLLTDSKDESKKVFNMLINELSSSMWVSSDFGYGSESKAVPAVIRQEQAGERPGIVPEDADGQHRPTCEVSAPTMNKIFSHIYVEKEALSYPLAKNILSKRKDGIQIITNHYKDVFNRPGQRYSVQKRSPKLILAVNRGVELYKGSKLCDNFGYENFLYASHVMNCLYDCEYCYLSGMYNSANVVVFVNVEDYLEAARARLPAYICLSYDTDLMALEGMTGILEKWIHFCYENKDVVVEIRTKSGNYSSISHLKPTDNVILAWTLSPGEVVSRYERGTASLETRLKCIKAATRDGWSVRICIDPILAANPPAWEDIYRKACREIRDELADIKLTGVSYGTFRVPKEFCKRMRRQRPDSDILSYPFENRDGVMCYNKPLEERMLSILREEFSRE